MLQQQPRQGTLVIGPFSTIEDVDEAGCALLGYSKDELVGLHGSELIPREHRPSVAVALDRIRRSDLALPTPGFIMRKDGSVLSIELTARKLPYNRLAFGLRPTSAAS